MSNLSIALEEHFISSHLSEQNNFTTRYKNFSTEIYENLKDVSTGGRRLKEMDEGNVTLQIISHAPGASSADPAPVSKANDELAAAIKSSGGRYAGFACLPMAHAADAAKELERCVKELGFVGALIDNHTEAGEFYDAEKFWPVFEKAQELDTVVYIHPTFPTEEMDRILYKGNYGPKAQTMLGMAALGWHQDVALHIMRLFAASVFDKFPKLKIVIGHSGEMLPFQLERSDRMSGGFEHLHAEGKKAKTLQQVWDENIWVTTSGMFSLNPMACMLRNTKIERILYSVDWPFAPNKAGWAFLEDLKNSGMVSEEDWEKIAYKNAEKLLGVKAKQ